MQYQFTERLTSGVVKLSPSAVNISFFVVPWSPTAEQTKLKSTTCTLYMTETPKLAIVCQNADK